MGRTPVHRRVRRPPTRPSGRLEQIQRRPMKLTAALLTLFVLALWSYWPIIASLLHTLRTSDDYSAGQLVPLVVVFLIWRDRKTLGGLQLVPCWPGGLLLLSLAEAARIYGSLSMRQSIEQYAIVLALAGLILWVAGWRLLRRLLWILLFLSLMMPLPNVLHSRIGPPLQRLATTGSVFLLEASGIHVTQQGNIVMLNDAMSVAVAEACSGLRMLTAFVIVAAFVAYMVKRPPWQKAVLLASSVPIAVICNTIRIALTAVLMLYVSVQLAQRFFHDFAGLVMMPAAVSLLFGELWLMDKLLMDAPERESPRRHVVARTPPASPASGSPPRPGHPAPRTDEVRAESR
jgi:exosortase